MNTVKAIKVAKNFVRYGRAPELDISMGVWVNGHQIVSINYVPGLIDNNGQWLLAYEIAKRFGFEGEPNEQMQITRETLLRDFNDHEASLR